ncbi:MAG: hypothetical protein ABSE73_07710 [Planctomycetota bacterium]
MENQQSCQPAASGKKRRAFLLCLAGGIGGAFAAGAVGLRFFGACERAAAGKSPSPLLPPLPGQSSAKGHVMLDELSRDTFARHLHSKFSIQPEGAEGVAVELASVSPAKTQRAGNKHLECFSLVFKGPSDPLLPQRTYSMAHSQIGTFELFLVPVGKQEDGVRYEAVFNRLA